MRLSPVLTGHPADPIDRLMFVTDGTVLRVGGALGTPEYDYLNGGRVSVRDRRRLAGARLVSSAGGSPADVLLADAVCRLPILDELNADQFVEWYCTEALAGLDFRELCRDGNDPTCYDDDPAYLAHLEDSYNAGEWGHDDDPAAVEVVPVCSVPDFGGAYVESPAVRLSGVPAWFVAWRLRLLHAPKIELLDALGAYAWSGGPVPVVLDADWARDTVRKFQRRAGVTL